MLHDKNLRDTNSFDLRTLISDTPGTMFATASKVLVDWLLLRNTNNRQLRNRNTDYIKQQVETGRYVLTNQGIGLDCEGQLIDGQHRLEAIKEAGYPPVPLLIVYGLSLEARAAVDTGLKRSYADIMHFAFDHPEASATMIAIARFWGIHTYFDGTPRRVSGSELCGWYVDLLPAMEKVLAIPNAKRYAAPILAAICARLRAVADDPRPLVFLERVISGANLQASSPELTFRNWLSNNGGPGNTEQVKRYKATASALLAFLEGRSLSKLVIREDPIPELLRHRGAE